MRRRTARLNRDTIDGTKRKKAVAAVSLARYTPGMTRIVFTLRVQHRDDGRVYAELLREDGTWTEPATRYLSTLDTAAEAILEEFGVAAVVERSDADPHTRFYTVTTTAPRLQNFGFAPWTMKEKLKVTHAYVVEPNSGYDPV